MRLKFCIVIGLLVWLQGCVLFVPEKKTDSPSVKSSEVYQAPPLLQFELPTHKLLYNAEFFSNTEEKTVLYLLKQGAYYANLKDSYRLKACKALADVYEEDGFWQAGWLLAYSFSDRGSCITHKERLKILYELNSLISLHKEIQWLNLAQIQTLEHINYLKARSATLKEKISILENQLKKSKDENVMLETLIKELKAIEDIMNKRVSDESS